MICKWAPKFFFFFLTERKRRGEKKKKYISKYYIMVNIIKMSFISFFTPCNVSVTKSTTYFHYVIFYKYNKFL